MFEHEMRTRACNARRMVNGLERALKGKLIANRGKFEYVCALSVCCDSIYVKNVKHSHA